MTLSLSRRRFLATAAAVAGPTVASPRTRAAPSERITVGFVGLGERGMKLLGEFLAEPDVQVVALCDVEELHYRERDWGVGAPLGRGPARERVVAARGQAPAVVTTDYQDVCSHDEVDAVVVATPDHWHALCALEAIAQGKDIYCEKPLTHRFAEGRALCRAVAERGAVAQTGSQQRSEAVFRRAVELVRNGVLGRIQRIEVGLPPGYDAPMGDATVREPPDARAYERWCGPAAHLPYMRARHHRWWRGHSAFGGGVLMDWIGHHNDIAHWAIGVETQGPLSVRAEAWTLPAPDVYDTPAHYAIHCDYPGGIVSTISDAHPLGTKWIGTEGWLHVSRGRIKASDERWLASDFRDGQFRLPPVVNHVRDFLDGIKSRRPCVAPFSEAHRSITPGHLAFVSHALGRTIRWDAASERAVADDEAQRLLERLEYRPPWRVPG